MLSFVLVLALAACSDDDLDLTVIGSPGSTELEVGMDTCGADPTVTAEETSTEVRLIVDVDAEAGNDCRDAVIVELDEELGNRIVIDDASGDELKVRSGS